MKLLSRFDTENPPTEEATASLAMEDAEDLWILHNIVSPGDLVSLVTVRKVYREGTGQGDKNDRGDAKKVRVNLTLKVRRLVFEVESLRISGLIQNEIEGIAKGSHHSADVEPTSTLKLTKVIWDDAALRELRKATNFKAKCDLAAVLMSPGIANLYLVGGGSQLHRVANVEITVPKKRGGATARVAAKGGRSAAATEYDKRLCKFYDAVIAAIAKNIDWNTVKVLLVGSAGFLKEDFLTYLFNRVKLESNNPELKGIAENKNRLLPTYAESAWKHSLMAVLSDPALEGSMSETRAFGDIRAVNEVQKRLAQCDDRVTFGLRHCAHAAEENAIASIIVADCMVRITRTSHMLRRRQVGILMAKVEEGGGTVLLVSSAHLAGERVVALGGICALLRYAVDFSKVDNDVNYMPHMLCVDVAGMPITPAATPSETQSEDLDEQDGGFFFGAVDTSLEQPPLSSDYLLALARN